MGKSCIIHHLHCTKQAQQNWVFSNDWKAHAMKENKHPWKQEHTHKFRIHIQFWVAKFSNRFSPFPPLEAPPKKHPVFLSLPPSTNTSMEPFFNAMVTFSQFDHWKVPRISRMVDSLVDLWQFRCASRATLSWKNPMKSHKTGPLWASNLPKKTWCQLTKVWIFSSLHLWLHVFEWSFEHEHPWDDQGSSDQPEVDFSDASLVIKFLIKSFAAKIRWRLWMWLEKLQPLENSGRWKVQEPMPKIPM